MRKEIITLSISLLSIAQAMAADIVNSPDGKLQVSIDAIGGQLTYAASYDGIEVIRPSRLGLVTNIGTMGSDVKPEELKIKREELNIDYSLDIIKQQKVSKKANFMSVETDRLIVEMVVENNSIAFRYVLRKRGETGCARIMKELTEFRFPESTTTFLSPQSTAMIGWKRTKPSYEEEYECDEAMNKKSKYGQGYVFPCLFKVSDKAWALVSETGVTSRYCASHLSEYKDGAYGISYPMPEENNGNGTAEPAIALPGATPWRTVSIGQSAAQTAEETITWDVAEPQYETTKKYDYGKGTWSWILWQDNSINLRDQKAFVDLAQAMGYKYTLVDSFWDKNIGREGMKELADYARERGVQLVVWYSSSGYWNDIVQSPINIMDRAISRKAEMKWLNEIGATGIKVDFFGGDKQETMRLYEDILSDANDHGLLVVFHGTTLPRGWERMYPNYAGSEAVLASENLIFDQHFCDDEARITTLHPFVRNATGCMEFGGSFMNKHMNRGNNGGNIRKTSDTHELAQAVIFQNPVQFFALAPNNLEDAPKHCMDFLRDVPTLWDETRIVDGYPGKYVMLARRAGKKWYLAISNASEPREIKIDLGEFFASGSEVELYSDNEKTGTSTMIRTKIAAKKNKPLKLKVGKACGVVVVGQAK